jgi:hypothetical protein
MSTNLVGWLGARLFGQWQAREKILKHGLSLNANML